jgi:type IV secretory pathway VirB2 component (pilin)
MTKSEILELQQRLNEVGLAYLVLGEPLAEDGIYGPSTDRVYTEWLNRDSVMPSVTPPVAKPWWQSRAILGLLTVGLAWAAGKMGWLVDDEQITQILLAVLEAVGLVVAAIGTVRRKAPIDPTLVMRLPHGRDLRLPVRPERKTPGGSGRSDPRGYFGSD